MIGIGIGLGLGAQRRYGASNLLSGLDAIYSTNLIGLYVGSDIVVDGSGHVTSWPGRKGPSGTNTTANRFGVNVTDRRVALYSLSTDDKSISFGLSADVLVVVANSPSLPLSNYLTLGTLGTGSGEEVLTGNTGTSSWFIGGAQYRDGVLTSAISSGVHVYEGIKSGATSTAFRIGGGTTTGRVWTAPIYLVMALAAPQSAGERAAGLSLIQRYMYS